jgi:hypothetical protein
MKLPHARGLNKETFRILKVQVVRRGSALKRWDAKFVKRIGSKYTKVSVSHKKTVILDTILIVDTVFEAERQAAQY